MLWRGLQGIYSPKTPWEIIMSLNDVTTTPRARPRKRAKIPYAGKETPEEARMYRSDGMMHKALGWTIINHGRREKTGHRPAAKGA